MTDVSDVSNFVNELQSLMKPSEQDSTVVSSKKIKVLIVSTHINQVNGYSKVVYNIIKQLVSNGINVVHFATQKLVNADLSRRYPESVKVIEAVEKEPGFGLTELPVVIQKEKPDVVFIYNDLSVICAYIENIRKIESRTFKIWAYIDMVYTFAPQLMIDMMNRDVDRIFCFTKGWKDSLKSQGITRPLDVMSHGIDSSIHAIPRDVARQSLGLPKDVFLITSVNKNIPRKRLDLLVIAFVRLIVAFPLKQIFCLIIGDKGERGGYQLFDIFAREIKRNGGSVDVFGNRLLITEGNKCYSDSDINVIYNCGDVGVSCAEGEGFGLCTFEQMSLGIPQIVPEINGYNEYCTNENSIMIKPRLRYYIPQVHHSVTGEAQMVDPEDVKKALERYVFDESEKSLHGRLGKEVCAGYTWEKCVAIMVRRLKELDDDL